MTLETLKPTKKSYQPLALDGLLSRNYDSAERVIHSQPQNKCQSRGSSAASRSKASGQRSPEINKRLLSPLKVQQSKARSPKQQMLYVKPSVEHPRLYDMGLAAEFIDNL